MNHTSPQNPAANGRDSNGKFVKGNSGGPGNPFARQMARFRKELMLAVTDEDVRDMAKGFVDMAKNGSVPAAKLLFSYIMGKPTDPASEPDKLDAHEWNLFTESAAMQKNATSIWDVPSPELALTILRFMRAALGEKSRMEMMNDLQEQNRADEAKRDRKKKRKGPRQQKRAPSNTREHQRPAPDGRTPSTNGVTRSPKRESAFAHTSALSARESTKRLGTANREPSKNGIAAPSTNGSARRQSVREGRRSPSTNGDGAPSTNGDSQNRPPLPDWLAQMPELAALFRLVPGAASAMSKLARAD